MHTGCIRMYMHAYVITHYMHNFQCVYIHEYIVHTYMFVYSYFSVLLFHWRDSDKDPVHLREVGITRITKYVCSMYMHLCIYAYYTYVYLSVCISVSVFIHVQGSVLNHIKNYSRFFRDGSDDDFMGRGFLPISVRICSWLSFVYWYLL